MKWSDEEVKQLSELLKTKNYIEVAEILGRTQASIYTKASKLGLNSPRRWSDEDIQYLSENWGKLQLKSIAKKLNRSVDAVKIKVCKLKLGPWLDSGDFITLHQFFNAVGYFGGDSYKLKSWGSRGLPIKEKTVDKCTFRVISITDFWKWAESHRSFIDFSKMEPLALGKEPEWVKEQRKIDQREKTRITTREWSRYDDETLKSALKRYKYTYPELSKKLNRTEGAIQRRINDLDLKERPLRESPHSVWTDKQLETLSNCIDGCLSYTQMSDLIGKSAKAIRRKISCIYGTEVLDKVRAIKNTPQATGNSLESKRK